MNRIGVRPVRSTLFSIIWIYYPRHCTSHYYSITAKTSLA